MAEYGSAPAGEVFKCTCSHIEREIGYICRFRTNIGTLQANVRTLSAKKADVCNRIAEADRNNERPRQEVETWLKEVDNVLTEAAKIDGKAARIDHWFKGWVLCSRFSTGRNGQKMIGITQWLLGQADAFGDTVADKIAAQDMVPAPSGDRVAVENTNAISGKLVGESESESGRAVQIFISETRNAFGNRVSDRKVVLNMVPENTNVIEDKVFDIQNLASTGDEILSKDLKSNGEFEAFGSRLTTAKEIIQALETDSMISVLGVYGMPGVGKSTLVLAVADHMKKQKIFDEVVVVKLFPNPDMKSIQDDIAKQLNLKFEADENIVSRKNSLLRRLDRDPQTLIVLDNLWERVELTEMGVPYESKYCKVLFTTRNRNVCNSMETWNQIEVKLLLLEESMQLFRRKAGDIVDTFEFGIVARELVNECQGLPLALVTLGRVLHNKKLVIWEDTRRKLWKSCLTALDVVLTCIEISYEYIQSKEQKLCFLFCCLFPAGYLISMDQLLYYMIGEGLLSDVETLEDARCSLQVIVDELISSSLFLNTETGCIEMQNVIRDVAISMASGSRADHGFMVRVMQGWPDVELGKCKRLSFSTTKGSGIQWRFPSEIKAAELLTLSFHGNENLHQIPANLFKELPSLMTLDLSYTGIKELPQSLEFLVKLCALLLEGCHLEDVELSNKLERLKLFSLRYSTTKRFSVLGEMRTLKLLDLSYTSMLQSVAANVVSSFPKLEELYLFESLYVWGAEGKEAGEHASLSEVISLTQLTCLELRFGMLNQCLSSSIPVWGNLKRFKIVVGMVDMVKDFSSLGMGDNMLSERSMFLELESNSQSVADWLIVLMGRTYLLHLKGCGSLDQLMQQGPSPQVIFNELNVLILSSCLDAISLIPCDLLVIFRRLHKLVIDSYESMVKLIEFNVEDKKTSMGATSSSSIIRGSFSNMPPSSVFPNLACLRLSKCAKLRYLFPMRVIRALSQLQMLYISDCITMERVIEHENAEDHGNADNDTMILPRLKLLSLEELPGLLLFVQKNIHVNWPSLEELTVKSCLGLEKLPFGPHSVPKLRTLVVDNENWFVNMQWDDVFVKHRLVLLLNILILSECESLKELHAPWPLTLRTLTMHDYRGVSLIPCDLLAPNLENVKVNKSRNLQMLIDFGDGASSSSSVSVAGLSKSTPFSVFGNLLCLEIFSCEKLKYLLPMRVVRVLSHLKKLHVRDCPSMETLIIHETAEDDGGADKDVGALPKLGYLTLEKLPQLSSFARQDVLFDWPSLEDLIVNGCLGLKKLPLGPDSALKLKSIQAFPDTWFGSLDWDDQGVKLRLQSFVK